MCISDVGPFPMSSGGSLMHLPFVQVQKVLNRDFLHVVCRHRLPCI